MITYPSEHAFFCNPDQLQPLDSEIQSQRLTLINMLWVPIKNSLIQVISSTDDVNILKTESIPILNFPLAQNPI